MSATVDRPPVDTPDAGVIEEARARQRRHSLAAALVVLAAVGLITWALGFSGGSRSTDPSGPSTAPTRALTLTFRHGLPYVNGEPLVVGIAPTFGAGVVGLDIRALHSGQAGGPYPTAANPIVGLFADGVLTADNRPVDGLIDATVVASSVATMRVAHVGTFASHRAVGLPPGYRVFVFARPPGSRGTVIAPGSPTAPLPVDQRPALTETFYDSTGKQIMSTPPGAFRLPSSYWRAPTQPASNARCLLASALSGVIPQWGQVATTITPDPHATRAQYLSCLDDWYRWHGASFEIAILLNAHSPTTAAAPLWGSRPLAGHPGITVVAPVEDRAQLPSLPPPLLAQLTKRFGRARALRILAHAPRQTPTVYAPGMIAKRVGPAWLVVRDGNSLAQRLQFLNGLRISRLNLG
jgi:hypothetical protein